MAEAQPTSLPPGMQDGPTPMPEIPVGPPVDEMGVNNPIVNVSEYVKYRYYKCQNCGKKEFAGGLDEAEYVDCVCNTGPTDPKTRKAPHGKMKLYTYVARRDGVTMSPLDYQKAQHQKA